MTPRTQLQQLDDMLAERRAEYRQLEKDIHALQAQKQQLIQVLEGQLDLFMDQVANSHLLLKEVRHG
ncbi:hypothetical protein [Halomonas huangheensis]|uniref:Uncharacterized protein n=1 Tax=Halomonas huangheensis TaxID=1178482 RepID=W1NA90_9GAMM|nr:hypothetical protein [Halomonas huangheensis]ALM54127.1 hypothetical protein AR456_18980 [Halomonas huangheensis]ERL52477.1 hypothetical protein BJB45_07960 [Halomonas huangheensis]